MQRGQGSAGEQPWEPGADAGRTAHGACALRCDPLLWVSKLISPQHSLTLAARAGPHCKY